MIWDLPRLPHQFWNIKKNRTHFIEYVGRELSLQNIQDWYSVSAQKVIRLGGGSLLAHFYNNSVSKLITDTINYKWQIFKFQVVPKRYWTLKNQIEYFEWVENRLVSIPREWTLLTFSILRKNYGRSVLEASHNSSPSKFISALTPHLCWEVWDFYARGGSLDYWGNTDHQKRYFEWLGVMLDYREDRDWYRIHYSDFVNNGGYFLLHLYGNPASFVTRYAPSLKVWKFEKSNCLKKKDWRDRKLQWSIFNTLKEEYNIEQDSEWLNFSTQFMIRQRFKSLLFHFSNSPMRFISTFLDPNSLKNHKKLVEQLQFFWHGEDVSSTEKFLSSFIGTRLFPGSHLYFRHRLLRLREVDIFLPSLAMAFEYQGEHHYIPIGKTEAFSTQKNIKKQDVRKEYTCNVLGISLVKIPFWVDFRGTSPTATKREIFKRLERRHRFDLTKNNNNIP